MNTIYNEHRHNIITSIDLLATRSLFSKVSLPFRFNWRDMTCRCWDARASAEMIIGLIYKRLYVLFVSPRKARTHWTNLILDQIIISGAFNICSPTKFLIFILFADNFLVFTIGCGCPNGGRYFLYKDYKMQFGQKIILRANLIIK